MQIGETRLPGVFVVDLDPRSDSRGFFARSFCAEEFRVRGMNPVVAQANLSYNHHCGTVRGMHLCFPPCGETKLVRCIAGAICDVLVDLRPSSPTFLEHIQMVLTAENRRALYVPELVAHGFQTLADAAEVEYLMGAPYAPGHQHGLRPSDPVLAIEWPLSVAAVSPRDLSWPLLPPRLRTRT